MKILKIMLTICLFFSLIEMATAKNINLYDEPNPKAKIVGKIDAEAGFVPIYSPDGKWMKVGDPRNGNVGWIQSSELVNTQNNVTGFTFSQRYVNDGKNPQSYVVQFGTPKPISSKEAEAMMKQVQTRQQQIQKEMQKMMQEVFGQSWNQAPVFMPILIIPNSDQKPTGKN